MAAVSPRLPKYRKHSTRDKAFVEVSGKRTYLQGAYDSPESREHYGQILADLVAKPRARGSAEGLPRATPWKTPAVSITLGELAGRWLTHLEQTGQGSEYHHARGLCCKISQAEAATPASEFGPKALKAVRERMIADEWTRGYVNDQVQRLRRMFRFAVEEELVPAGVWEALKAVAGLKKGRTVAPEGRDVLPASLRDVALAARRASPTVRAMIFTQWWTGMRSHHLCSMRPADIDFTSFDDVWVYVPQRHEKGRGKTLVVTIGPRVQRLLRRRVNRGEERPIFSPHDACREAGREPSGEVREAYDPNSYRQAVVRACHRADIKPFHPHQLRHSAATNVRRVAGLEAAQAVLGHDRIDVTQIYAEKDLQLAVDAARKLG